MRQKFIATSMKMRNKTNEIHYRINRFSLEMTTFHCFDIIHTHIQLREEKFTIENKKKVID